MKSRSILLSMAVIVAVQFGALGQETKLIAPPGLGSPIPPVFPPPIPLPTPLPHPLPPLIPVLPPVLHPLPPPIPLPPLINGQIVNSLTLPGYDFNVLEISGQYSELLVDPTEPIITPLNPGNPLGIFPGQTLPVYGGAATNTLGFTATFALENKTAVARTFSFAAEYYANLRVGFRVLDANDNVIWQSYQLLVDLPPLAQPVELTLPTGATWSKQVFVPIINPGAPVLGPGTYTLEAEITGSPAFSARSSFEVGYTVGGPIIHPIPFPVPHPLDR